MIPAQPEKGKSIPHGFEAPAIREYPDGGPWRRSFRLRAFERRPVIFNRWPRDGEPDIDGIVITKSPLYWVLDGVQFRRSRRHVHTPHGGIQARLDLRCRTCGKPRGDGWHGLAASLWARCRGCYRQPPNIPEGFRECSRCRRIRQREAFGPRESQCRECRAELARMRRAEVRSDSSSVRKAGDRDTRKSLKRGGPLYTSARDETQASPGPVRPRVLDEVRRLSPWAADRLARLLERRAALSELADRARDGSSKFDTPRPHDPEAVRRRIAQGFE